MNRGFHLKTYRKYKNGNRHITTFIDVLRVMPLIVCRIMMYVIMLKISV